MQAIGTILNRDEMERRRLDAACELLQGISQSKVARKYGVSRTTASRWHRALSDKGTEALKKRRATGRPPRLTTDQFRQIPQIHSLGASQFGFPDDRWTTVRLAVAIEKTFGVRYDNDHVGRLMSKLGLRSPRQRRRFLDTPAPAPAYAPSYPAAGQIGVPAY